MIPLKIWLIVGEIYTITMLMINSKDVLLYVVQARTPYIRLTTTIAMIVMVAFGPLIMLMRLRRKTR